MVRYDDEHMKDKFRRILELVQQTGDTMVVTDPDGEEVFVVMGLDRYESMIYKPGFKPDSDPGLNVSINKSFVEENTSRQPDIWDTMQPAGEKGETWDLAKLQEDELADLEDQYKQFTQKNVVEAMEEVQKPTENQFKKAEENEDFGEEQFYLEPIE